MHLAVAELIAFSKKQILEKTKGTIPNVYISGRVKSINSIYRKTIMRNQSINDIFA